MNKLNCFLLTRGQIDDCTRWLVERGYMTHPISCKDFELATVIRHLGDGDLIDLGADGSFVLHNAMIKRIRGRKVGVDLIEVIGNNKAEGAEYFKGDIQETGLPDDSFDTVVSLSTIEHQVDFSRFAKEVGRLLRSGGQAIVSFDYFDPKPDTAKRQLYKLDWNILDRKDVETLVKEFSDNGMELSSEIDWTIQDAVINPAYCSPAPVSYTFGILHFKKA